MPGLARWLDPILNPLACLPPPEISEEPPNAAVLLKRLEAMLQHRLKYALTGEKHSIVRGQGLDFADLREYVPGDDIRKIDWNVFARTLTPHVREYHEEKQLTLWLAVDGTPSMQFGRRKTKLDLGIELAGLFGLLAHQAGHKLGAFLIDGTRDRIIAPRSGYGHVQHIMQSLLDLKTEAPVSVLANDPFPVACQKLSHLVQKNATVIFISDFLSATSAWHPPLGQLSRHAKMIYLLLADPVETRLPEGLGLLPVLDPETGALAELDTGSPDFRQAYEAHFQRQQKEILSLLKDTGPAVTGTTEQSPVDILLQLAQSGGPRR